MSWSRARPDAARAGVLLSAALAITLALEGCGFHPLYARPGDGGPSPVAEFAAIRIAPLPDRIGQQMHNLLRDRLNPRGQALEPAYVLRVSLRERRRNLGIRRDETATRANLILDANFDLHNARTNEVLLSGRASSTNSFNILENQFATLISENNARERALRELSEDIRTRLGIYFAQAQGPAS